MAKKKKEELGVSVEVMDDVAQVIKNHEENKVLDAKEIEDVFSQVEEVGQESATTSEDKAVPERSSPDWHDYVMNEFLQEELVDGSPTVDGLYRVAQKLVGEVVDYRPDVFQSPNPQNNMTAVCGATFTFQILDENGYEKNIKRFGGVGEVNIANAEPQWGRYAASFAETRAKARALRQVLGLRKVVAAEEKTDLPIEDVGLNGTITDQQFIVLETMAARVDINLKKLLVRMAEEKKLEVKTLRLIPSYIGRDTIARLSEYQRSMDKRDPDLIGYDPKWRS